MKCVFIFLASITLSALADHKALGLLDYSQRTFPCESYQEAERLAEEQDEAEHLYIYAVCQFHRGGIVQGMELMRELAEWGDARAQYFLGQMYLRGREVRESAKRAFFWIELAAKQGHIGAQYALGNIYRDGRGVEKDEEMADFWIQTAAEQSPAVDDVFNKEWHKLREVDGHPSSWLQDAKKKVQPWIQSTKEKTQPLVEGTRRWFGERLKDAADILSVGTEESADASETEIAVVEEETDPAQGADSVVDEDLVEEDKTNGGPSATDNSVFQ